MEFLLSVSIAQTKRNNEAGSNRGETASDFYIVPVNKSTGQEGKLN